MQPRSPRSRPGGRTDAASTAKDSDADYMAARQSSLLRTAYLLTGDRHTAQDLVQTSLAELYLSWDKVQRRELVDGISSGHRIAARVSTSMAGTCSAVFDPSLGRLWRTCDYRLGRFSPDGRHVLATNAYGDGLAELAMTHQSGFWDLVRLDLDGNAESTVRPVQGDELTPPFHLAPLR